MQAGATFSAAWRGVTMLAAYSKHAKQHWHCITFIDTPLRASLAFGNSPTSDTAIEDNSQGQNVLTSKRAKRAEPQR
jgi:hypothetical protein